MAKSQNQKMKLTYLSEILCKYTDEEHPMSVAEMISHLEEMGVHAERKSIYDDLECLRQYGMNIVTAPGREKKCYLAENIFQLPELKVLADSVAASRFITEKKSRELIKKLGSLTSVYRSRSIQRQVYVNNRPKHSNESIYYNIDPIHRAISDNRKIKFRYFDYNREKKKTFRRNGEYYHAPPFVLVYHNDNYYLIGKCEQDEAPLSQFQGRQDVWNGASFRMPRKACGRRKRAHHADARHVRGSEMRRRAFLRTVVGGNHDGQIRKRHSYSSRRKPRPFQNQNSRRGFAGILGMDFPVRTAG